MKNPYIIYTLSKERTSQRFKASKIPDIVNDIDRFLSACTTTSWQEPETVELTAYTAYDETDPADLLQEIIRKTTARFGLSVSEPVSYHYPSGQPDSTLKYTWKFPKEKLAEVIQYIVDSSPLPKSNFGPLQLFFTYNFWLKNPLTNEVLPAQERSSSLLIWFSRGRSCSPILVFPFDQANQPFWDYIDRISSFLPFTLEEKYLRLARINKQGEVSSFKKIQRIQQP